MGNDQVLYYSEAQAGPLNILGSRSVRAVKPFKDAGQVGGRNPVAGIRNLDSGKPIRSLSPDGDRAARPIELDCVLNQVVEYLAEPGCVGSDRQVIGHRNLEPDLHLLSFRLEQHYRLGNGGLESNALGRKIHVT